MKNEGRILLESSLMNENQPSNKSRMPAASSKRSRKLSASARKHKKKQAERVSNFAKFIKKSENQQQRLPPSHSSGPEAPQQESIGNNNKNENVMSFFDKAVNQQNALENETKSSSGAVFTQDMADINLDAIIQHHYDNAKESSSSEGTSSRLTQETMSSTTEDSNSASLPVAAQSNTINNVNNNSSHAGRTQQPLSRMGSLDSVKSKPSPSLSEHQKARSEANRLRALRLRKQKKMNQKSPTSIEVAKKPQQRESIRQASAESGTGSAAANPSHESVTSNSSDKAQITSQTPSHYAQHPLEAMKRNENRGEADTTSAGMDSSQESMEPSTAPQVEGLSFYYDKEQEEQKESSSNRRKSGITLTQQGFVERNVTKKRKIERETFPTEIHFPERHRGISGVMFKKGDVWYSDRPEFDGWAFLIEHIDFQNKAHVIKAHAFLRLEKTFIGQQEAVKLEHTGWVLVKKHDDLPANGCIKLKDLSVRMSQDIPFHMHLDNRHLALRYEEVGDIVSYYNKKGKPLSTSPNNQLQQPRVCDCFAGGGGMSAGIREAGFFSEKSYKVDMDAPACETLRANFPESTVFQTDIRDLNDNYRRNRINLLASLVDYLHMSPPCQGFSRVNTSGGCKDIQNNNCTLECIETVRLLQPSHLTMENVPGILDDKPTRAERTKKSYLQEFIGGLLSQEYQVRICKRLNAQSYGDPQDRERVIVFGCKKGFALPSPPSPTHGKEAHLKDVVTVRDALRDLECIEPTKDGKVWLNDGSFAHGHYSKDSTRVENHEPDVELQPDLPAKTVRKQNRIVHYNRKRNATILERARLMSFPDNYVFEGSQGVQSDQIGNAIPVCLATAIANAVKESFILGLHEPSS
mmetsp:Transcript_18984/g.38244  ORF Transcript_18984/g.38244 Transcript_18984/m.38244 type:complete len:864 (+) Transcript_18984:22-2613(+)